MRYLFVLIAFLSATLLSPLAMAQEAQSCGADSDASTRIEANSETGEIHFYIKGELAAVLKDDGLHVRNDVNYGGTIADTGDEFYFQKTQTAQDQDDAL